MIIPPARGRTLAAIDGPEPGALAMARDVVLAGFVAGGGAPLVVRAHGWERPCVSFGRGQQVAPGPVSALAAAGVDAVRRPTGGGWLLHLPGDLAITLATSQRARSGSLRAAARLVSGAIAAGLSTAGVAAGLTTPEPASGRASRADVCFARKDPDEVEADGVKLAGVALGRVRRALLVQSAIPLVPAGDALAAVAAAWDSPRAIAAERLQGVDADALAGAIAAALAGPEGPAAWSWPGPLAREARCLADEMTIGRKAEEES